MQELDLSLHDTAAARLSGAAADYADGAVVPPHRHARCQLLATLQGVVEVRTPAARWLIPPDRAICLPPDTDHELLMRGAVRVRCLYLAPEVRPDLQQAPGVIAVSALLREIIAELALLSTDIETGRRGQLLSELLLEELDRPADAAYLLPWPQDGRIARVCQQLLDQPALNLTAQQWAGQLAMSLRTFHRHFERQTGMRFGRWRQQARLLHALEALNRGQAVLQTALDCGYDSHSAFTVAFRRHFGFTPSTARA